jgi:hypothetical protein
MVSCSRPRETLLDSHDLQKFRLHCTNNKDTIMTFLSRLMDAEWLTSVQDLITSTSSEQG